MIQLRQIVTQTLMIHDVIQRSRCCGGRVQRDVGIGASRIEDKFDVVKAYHQMYVYSCSIWIILDSTAVCSLQSTR